MKRQILTSLVAFSLSIGFQVNIHAGCPYVQGQVQADSNDSFVTAVSDLFNDPASYNGITITGGFNLSEQPGTFGAKYSTPNIFANNNTSNFIVNFKGYALNCNGNDEGLFFNVEPNYQCIQCDEGCSDSFATPALWNQASSVAIQNAILNVGPIPYIYLYGIPDGWEGNSWNITVSSEIGNPTLYFVNGDIDQSYYPGTPYYFAPLTDNFNFETAGETVYVSIPPDVTISFEGVISGVGEPEFTGSGGINLYGINTLTGNLRIAGPTPIQINNNASFGAGSVTFFNDATVMLVPNDGTTLSIANDISINSGSHNVSLTFSAASPPSINLVLSGVISGSTSYPATVTVDSLASLTITGANTYAGGTTLSIPTTIGGTSPFGTGTVTIENNASLAGFGTIPNTIFSTGDVYFSGGSTGPLTLSGISSSMQSLYLDSYTLELQGTLATNEMNLSGNQLTISGGTLTLSPTSSTITSLSENLSIQLTNGGIIELLVSDLTISEGEQIQIGNPNVANDSGGFSVANNTVFTISTPLTGSGTMNIGASSGSGGFLTLSGDNSGFSGNISLTGAVLQVSSLENLGSAEELTLNSGGVFSPNGSFVSTMGLNIQADDTIFSVTGSGLTTILTGPLTFSSGGTLNINSTGTGGLLPSQAVSGVPTIELNQGVFITNSFGINGGAIHGPTSSTSGVPALVLYEINPATINGELSGELSVTIGGTETITFLSTGMSYTGTTTIGSNFNGTSFPSGSSYTGMLSVSEQACFGNSSGIVGQGGTLEITGSNSFSLPIDFSTQAPSLDISLDNNVTATWTGTITSSTGGSSLAIAGAGTFVLTSNNSATFTEGSITSSGGTLSVSSDNAFGGSLVALYGSGGTYLTTASTSSSRQVYLNSGSTTTFSANSGVTWTFIGSNIQGPGNLNIGGEGTVVFQSSPEQTGLTTLSSGTLSISSNIPIPNLTLQGGTFLLDGSFTYSENMGLAGSGGTISVPSGKSTTLAGIISGNGDLTLEGESMISLVGNNTFTGNFSIGENTTIELDSETALGSPTSSNLLNFANNSVLGVNYSFTTPYGIAIADNATATIALDGSQQVIFQGAIQGGTSSTLNISASTGFVAFLPSTDPYIPTINIIYGTFIADPSAVSDDTGGSTIIGIGSFLLYNDSGDDFNGSIGGEVSLIIGGPEATALSPTSNTYTGSTVIGSNFDGTGYGSSYIGTAQVNSATCFPSSSEVIGYGGTLQVVTTGLTFTNPFKIDSPGLTMTINPGLSITNFVLDWSGDLSGDGSLAINGGGTATFSGSNSDFSGNVTVNSGITLGFSSGANLGSGSLSMEGGTVSFSGTVISGPISLGASGGTFTVDSSGGTTQGVLSGTGPLTVQGSGTFTLQASNNSSGGMFLGSGTTLSVGSDLAMGSTLSLNGGTLQLTGNFSSSQPIALISDSTIESTESTVLSGEISGDLYNLTVSGEGTLALSGSNTYSGNTILQGGTTLSISSDLNLGTSSTDSVVIFDSGTLEMTSSFSSVRGLQTTGNGTISVPDSTITASFTGNGSFASGTSLTMTGAGTFSYQPSVSTLLPSLILNEGVFSTNLTLINSTSSGTAVSGSGGSLEFNDPTGGTFHGTLAGDISVVIADNGPITFQATGNTYTGTTAIYGTLSVSASSCLGSSNSIIGNGGTFQITDTDTFSSLINLEQGLTVSADKDTTPTLSGEISGSGSFTITGEGTVISSGVITNTGGVIIENGTFSLGSIPNSDIGGSSNQVTFNNGTLLATGNINVFGPVTLEGSGNTVSVNAPTQYYSVFFNKEISGTGDILISGTGTVSFFAQNSYTGTTTVSSGFLEIAPDINVGSSLIFDGGTVTFMLSSETIFSQEIVLESGGGTIYAPGVEVTLSNVISGTGSLEFTGFGGIITLDQSNTYSGNTTLSNGAILEISADDNLGSASGSIILNGGILAPQASLTSSRQIQLQLTPSGFNVPAGVVAVYNGTILSSSVASVLNSAGEGVLALLPSTTLGSGITYIPSLSTEGNVVGNLISFEETNASIAPKASLEFYETTGGTFQGKITATESSMTPGSIIIGGTKGVTFLSSTFPSSPAEGVAFTGDLVIGSNFNGSSFTGDSYQGTLVISAASCLGNIGHLIGSSGTLQITGSDTFSTPLSFSQGLAISVNGNETATWSGLFTGNGPLSITGEGTLVVETDNSSSSSGYTGDINLNSGTLSLATTGALGSGTLTATGGTLSTTGSSNVQITNGISISTGGALSFVAGSSGATLSGVVTGSGNLTLNGGVTSIADAGINSSVQVTVSSGATLSTSSNLSLGTLSLGGGTLLLSGSIVLDQGLTLSAESTLSTTGTSSLSGVVAESVSLTNLIVAGGGTLTLSGVNTYSGNTTIQGGTTLSISSDVNLGTSSTDSVVIFDSGILGITNSFSSTRGLQTTGNGTISVPDAETTASFTGNGSFDSGASLTMTGAGTFSYQPSVSSLLPSLILNGGTFSTNLTLINSTSSGTAVSGSVGSLEFNDPTGGTFHGTLAGDISVVIADNGPITFQSTGNTYTGTTTIYGTLSVSANSCFGNTSGIMGGGGILQISETGTFASVINTAQGITLSTSNAKTTTWSSAISGSGLLTVSGEGTLVLTNSSNTNTGGVEIDGGALSISAGGSLGTGPFSMLGGIFLVTAETSINNTTTLSDAVSFLLSGATTFSSALSGTGTLSIQGGSILTLEENAYTGSISLSESSTLATSSLEGSLSMSDSSFFQMISSSTNEFSSSASISLVDSSTLTFNPTGGTATLSGVISDNGSLTLNSSDGSTLVLSGTNTYTGGSVAASGTLSFSQDSNLGGENGELVGDGGDFEANISSSTSTITSNRKTTLNETTTCTVLNAGTTWVISEAIGGSGGLNVAGLGTLSIVSDTTYTGKTTVETGATLQVNGNIVSSGDPIVNAGAMLSGTGFVGETQAFGTIAPGSAESPVGTLTIEGDLHHHFGSNLLIAIEGSESSFLLVNGVAEIEDGAFLLPVLRAADYSEERSYTALTATGGITGSFSSSELEVPAFFLVGGIQYDANNVYLTLIPEELSSSSVQGINAENVAKALDDTIAWNRAHVNYHASPNGPVADPEPRSEDVLASLLPLSESERNIALNELYSTLYTGVVITAETSFIQVATIEQEQMERKMNRRSCASKEKAYSVWAVPFGGFLNQGSENTSYGLTPSYHSSTGGITIGIDRKWGCFTAGALGAYSYSHITWKKDLGKGNLSTGYGGVYAAALGKMFYANASVIGGWNSFSGTREIDYVSMRPKAHFGGVELLSHLDTGINFRFGGSERFLLRPFDRLDYITGKTNGYDESSAGEFGLHVSSNRAIFLRNELGLQFSSCLKGLGSTWTLSPKASWVREVRIKGSTYTEELLGSGESFSATGYFPNRNLFSPGFDLSLLNSHENFSFSLSYTGEFGSDYNNNQVRGEARFVF